jgi:dTDP-glucose 4,6-dehydratase
MRETGWQPRVGFEEGLSSTISWYRDNHGWMERVKSGEYQNYYDRNYANRELELERLRKP